MNIEIDLKLLQDKDMTADEFTALYLLHRQGVNYLNDIKFRVDWEKLEQNGYVKLGETTQKHIVRQEFLDLFSNDFDSMFNQLCATYPFKVNCNGSIRVLHAADADAKSNKKAKDKYRRIVGNKKHVHDKIMLLLDKQLTIMRDNLGFLQNLEVWINNHTWEKYEDINYKDTEKDGRPRITRSL